MAIEPGNVVTLKSGGQPMTVAAVEESNVECLWIGDDGELFRETIPSIALTVLEAEEEEEEEELEVEDEDDEDEGHDEGEDEDDEDQHTSKKKRRSA